MIVKDAHRPHEEYSCVLSFPDSQKVATRNTDNTLKIWDLRMFTKPVLHYSNLPNYFPGSKLALSPNGKHLLAGTSVGR
jgi:WD40 repeat protein